MELPSIAVLAGLFALGCCTGFMAGLLGIGGGMLLVPFLTMVFTQLAFPVEHIVKMAVATSLATIMFTSISSVRAHHSRGAVLWPVAMALVPGILLGSFLGAKGAGWLKSAWLAGFFACFVGWSAWRMLNPPSAAKQRDGLPGKGGLFGVGTLIGVLSALVGAGGAFISVPYMNSCKVPMHNAVGTSSALGFPIALAGTAGYIWAGMHQGGLPSGSAGFIYLPALIAIASASVLTAPLGAKTAHALPVKTLKKIFAYMLFSLAAYMGYRAISGG